MPRPRMPPLELSDEERAIILDSSNVVTGSGTFEQYIDHSNPSLGTFHQSYWWNATSWEGPGSPVVFFTPGEVAAAAYTGYLTERTITGQHAKAVGGAVIIMEHRYWGNSSPYVNQTTENLQYLNLEQSSADFAHFAKTVELPFDTTGQTNADQAPWIWVGGSYSGALASWVDKLQPGVFWAYHGSSGPVQVIYDYWQYFYPIQEGMPKNCSKDYEAIIEHVDGVFINGSAEEKTALKQMFAVEALAHDADAASAISSPIWAWQSISMTTGYSQFYQMCDAIEGVVENTTATYSPDGVGLDKALPNFANWFITKYIPGYCDGYGYSDWSGVDNVQCFDTFNSTTEAFHDWTPQNAVDRPWIWMTCNEPLFYWQTGAPRGFPTVFTRLADTTYYQRQCELWFPTEGNYTFGSNQGLTAADTNDRLGGWFNTNTTRMLSSEGEFDPWRSASVSSVFRPGGPFDGTEAAPVILMEGSIHCLDLIVSNAVHPSIAAAQKQEIAQISTWVDEYYTAKKAKEVTNAKRGKSDRRSPAVRLRRDWMKTVD
ncbi:serine carboxypeptidase S28 [Pseudomassariella vexata]|uniref:Serine carboxypeptidase S28 n=1 Tax=Pseudomassariella vexata TaxID=1141098 RepID=A0A1Y2EE90_9PEZI|nr:serine carboxypeptidase S28 [Pseudomassariella vexata]ORY69115.1 serine carboxypeptidase S28 [Pseudomassariella vexata]